MALTQVPYALTTGVEVADAAIVKSDVTANLTAGYTNTAHSYGTPTAASTVTVDFTLAPQAYLTNNAAFTLAPDSGVEGFQDILVTNAAAAGAITTSGFTAVLGDTVTTTDADKFLFQVRRLNSADILIVAALQ